MATQIISQSDKKSSLITFTLFLAGYVTNPPIIAAGLLLIDIADTFHVPIGVMSQISTSASILAIFTALIMAALSVKYKHKTLMQLGLIFLALSTLGCYFAADYQIMLIVFSIAGLGSSMVNPMTRSLIGEYIPREKQAQAMGWLIAGSSLSYLVSAPLMAYITNVGGWRNVFLLYILPMTLLSILVTHILLPQKNDDTEATLNYDVLNSFRTVLKDSSAMSCLIGIALFMAAYQAFLIYSASFYREIFKIDRIFTSNIVVLAAFMFTAGSLGASRIMERFGKKKVIVGFGLLGSILIALYTNIPDFWISLVVRTFGGFFMGVAFTGLSAMLLGQVPQFRGTVMSLESAIRSIGAALGTLVGGTLLLSGGYSQVALILGFLGVLGIIIVHLKTKES